MRTSADRPSKYSKRVLSKCPVCGNEAEVKPKWWGYATIGLRADDIATGATINRDYGFGVCCTDCMFGSDLWDYFPNGVKTEVQAIEAWNVVADLYDSRKVKNGKALLDVNDKLSWGKK